MSFVITPPPVATLPVRDDERRFPVHRIYCVGRNYAAHAVEMGHDPDKEPPFFFQKNPDNLVLDGRFPYPSASNDVHHEIELVVALKSGGTGIAVADALDHVFGYAVGLDMTRRDLQGAAKDLGRPWEVGKAFERSAPCTPLVPVAAIGHPASGAIWLEVNGKRPAEGRPQPDDLEGPGDDRLPLGPLRAPAGRPDHVRHAVRRRPGRPRRPPPRPRRQRRRPRGAGGLSRCESTYALRRLTPTWALVCREDLSRDGAARRGPGGTACWPLVGETVGE